VAALDGKSCVEKKIEEPTKPDAEKECNEKNEKIPVDEDSGRRIDKWKVENGKCVEIKKASSKTESEAPPASAKPEKVPENVTPPPRFVPIDIPTRRMYILPGMP
jgi:hypothetical protein